MKRFNIPLLSDGIQSLIKHKIDFKTKPIGALGQLESIATQICLIQQTTTPILNQPYLLVFAGDHGLAQEGVSAYPPEVTHQMVLNFIAGGAAINVFAKQHDMVLKIIDAGVNFDFPETLGHVNRKIDFGTQNSLQSQAMSTDQLDQAIAHGSGIVKDIFKKGSNIVGFGEMGIGNTSSASLLMSHLCQLPIIDCIGRGTGVDDAGIQRKTAILTAVQQKHQQLSSPEDLMKAVGGFEIAMMAGAMLQAAELGMTVLIDGFISTAALLWAHAINPDVLPYCLASHQSNESGHQKMLQFLNIEPILNLNLRLGEATGCALAYPIIQSSVGFINQMASFGDAKVSNK